MKTQISLIARRRRSTERRTAKPATNVDQCATCDNVRLVPHPDADRAESPVIPCPNCSQITRPIRRKYLADPTTCPWCGGAIQADAAPDVDEGVVTQEIDCTECNRRWFDLYRLADMRPL
jgi:transcription elongation factor Elf1